VQKVDPEIHSTVSLAGFGMFAWVGARGVTSLINEHISHKLLWPTSPQRWDGTRTRAKWAMPVSQILESDEFGERKTFPMLTRFLFPLIH
jgi:hypothetical protein